MAFSVTREEIAKGVGFTAITDSKFKTNYISVKFAVKTEKSTVSKNALAISIISSANAKYPSQSAFSRRLSTLYGAVFSGDVSKLGDNQIMSLNARFIGDKYTINGEKISYDMTNLMLDCIFDPAIQNGAFDTTLFSQRKQNLIDDIEAEINDKQSYAVICANKTIFKDEPYSLTVNGTKALVDECSPENVYSAYLDILKNSRIEISFVGEDCSGIKQMFVDAFSNLDRNDNTLTYYAPSVIKADTANVSDKMDVNQSKLYMAFKTDSHDHYALTFMNMIFGGTPFSKLFSNVREKLSLCYYCSSTYNDAKSCVCVSSGVDNVNIEKAKKEIINQLDDIKNGNFTDEDMNNSLLSIVNSLGSVEDYAGSLATTYYKRILKDDVTDFDTQVQRFKDVTKERICKAAQSLVLDTVYVMEANDGNN